MFRLSLSQLFRALRELPSSPCFSAGGSEMALVNPMSLDASAPFVRTTNYGSINEPVVSTATAEGAQQGLRRWLGRGLVAGVFFCAIVASVVLSEKPTAHPEVATAGTDDAWVAPPSVCVQMKCGPQLSEMSSSQYGGDWQVYACMDEGVLSLAACIVGTGLTNATRELLQCVVCASCQPGLGPLNASAMNVTCSPPPQHSRQQPSARR